MLNVIFLSNEEQTKKNYQKDFYNEDINVVLSGVQSLKENIKNVDAVIIDEVSYYNFVENCELIMEIRKMSKCFIWILSKNNSKINHMVYLQMGVDGISSNEVDSEEFSLFVKKALTRRYGNKENQSINSSYVHLDRAENDFKLNAQSLSFDLPNNEIIYFTKSEYKGFRLLFMNMGETITYSDLCLEVFGKEGDDKLYRAANLIFRLRKKLENLSSCPICIKTVRSVGYMINEK